MPNVLQQDFDAYSYLVSGIAENELQEVVADRLLARIRGLPFKPTGSDTGTTAAREIAVLDTATPEGKFVKGVFVGILRNDLSALCEYYGVWEDPSAIAILRLGDGYHLDWHNHLAQAGAASLLVYLFDDGEGEGGEFDHGTVGPDLGVPKDVKSIKPKHGTVIVLGDGSHPLNKHRAREWRGSGYRYLILFSYNSNDI